MLRQGVHSKIVQESPGYSTISFTMDIYSHVTPAMQAKVADQIDNLLLLVAEKNNTY